MRIFAIRHLVTPWNEQGLLQGTTDIELINNKKNNELSLALSSQLKEYSFDNVYVSPMKRAVQTAIRLEYTTHIVEPLVSEISFGRFEGTPKSEMMATLGDQWIQQPKNTELRPELEKLESRIKQFINAVQGEDVLLISHGAYIRGLASVLDIGSIDKMNQMDLQNGELKVFNL